MNNGQLEWETAGFDEFMGPMYAMMQRHGLLLVTRGRTGPPNVMTIGWGAVGVQWGIPVFTVMVRPSRFSFALLRDGGEFTVNVPGPDLAEAAEICGTRSGRTVNKFEAAGLIPIPARKVRPPALPQCPIQYECGTVFSAGMDPARLQAELGDKWYPEGDYHEFFHGRIKAVTVCRSMLAGIGGE